MAKKKKSAGTTEEVESELKECVPDPLPAPMDLSDAARNTRKEMAKVVRLFRNHYKTETPNHHRLLTRSILVQMTQAFDDCRDLDLLRIQAGDPPIYVEAFTVFYHPATIGVMDYRARTELKALAEGKTPVFAAMKAGDEKKARAKWTMERVKEDLRDGRETTDVIAKNARFIQKMIDDPNPQFFEEFGYELRMHRSTPLERDLGPWIVRAWLPLCLWECKADGKEAYDRFIQASQLLGRDMQGANPAQHYHKFVTAWRNVRSKKIKPRTELS